MNMQQKPLAERMRPKTLDEFIGQEQLVGPEGVISKMLDSGNIPSMILWGPPGTGKTTLARLMAAQTALQFFQLSAIQSGVKEVRQVLDAAKKMGKAMLFIDEIHRFNKAQQDALLGAVENGTICLIGATTENPSFEVISALRSRSQVYILNSHSKSSLEALIKRALKEDKLLSQRPISLRETEALIAFSGGDARKLLNNLELVVHNLNEGEEITNDRVKHVLKEVSPDYDKGGEQHYDLISAFIKSIRGSDPNAALYWMARMLNGGEDPKFIARRMLIAASEDIGNANPTALVLANNCFQAIDNIGMPEARIILAQAVTYLASSPKSNAGYIAINEAMKAAAESPDAKVPLHLRNAPTDLMKELNYGQNYQYVHDFDNSFVKQNYMPEGLEDESYYRPKDIGREKGLKDYLKACWGEKYSS